MPCLACFIFLPTRQSPLPPHPWRLILVILHLSLSLAAHFEQLGGVELHDVVVAIGPSPLVASWGREEERRQAALRTTRCVAEISEGTEWMLEEERGCDSPDREAVKRRWTASMRSPGAASCWREARVPIPSSSAPAGSDKGVRGPSTCHGQQRCRGSQGCDASAGAGELVGGGVHPANRGCIINVNREGVFSVQGRCVELIIEVCCVSLY